LDNQIKNLAGAMAARLSELQYGDQLTNLLKCNDPELRDEALLLYSEINALKSRLETI
jgi:hypothetical protein